MKVNQFHDGKCWEYLVQKKKNSIRRSEGTHTCNVYKYTICVVFVCIVYNFLYKLNYFISETFSKMDKEHSSVQVSLLKKIKRTPLTYGDSNQVVKI